MLTSAGESSAMHGALFSPSRDMRAPHCAVLLLAPSCAARRSTGYCGPTHVRFLCHGFMLWNGGKYACAHASVAQPAALLDLVMCSQRAPWHLHACTRC